MSNCGKRTCAHARSRVCGSPLPSIRVEGRSDEILRFTGPRGETVSIIPMALWSVIEDTPGVYRFQAIQIARQRLEVRLQAKTSDRAAVTWETVKQRVQAFLVAQGLANVSVERAANPPAPARLGRPLETPLAGHLGPCLLTPISRATA